MNEIEQALVDEYEDYEDQFVEKGAGVGKGNIRADEKKMAEKTKESKRNASDKSAVEGSQEKKTEQGREHINSVLSNLERKTDSEELEAALDNYVTWVNQSLTEGLLFDKERDTKEETFKSTEPDGKNPNKVILAVRIRHTITGIYAESREETDQSTNERLALDKIVERLDSHLEDWKTILSDGKEGGPVRELTKKELSTF